MSYPGAATTVVSGQEYAQQNYAGHQQFQPNDLRYQAAPYGAACGMPALPAYQGCGYAARQACPTSPEPAAYYPYQGSQGAAAFDSAYPNEEDMSSLAPRGCPSSQQAGYALNVNSLMPASWRSNTGCTATQSMDGSTWAKYSPTKEAFDRYITAQGSARLSLTTRSSQGRITGIPDLLRASPPMPLSSDEIPFFDAENRQNAVFQALGRFPMSTAC